MHKIKSKSTKCRRFFSKKMQNHAEKGVTAGGDAPKNQCGGN